MPYDFKRINHYENDKNNLRKNIFIFQLIHISYLIYTKIENITMVCFIYGDLSIGRYTFSKLLSRASDQFHIIDVIYNKSHLSDVTVT